MTMGRVLRWKVTRGADNKPVGYFASSGNKFQRRSYRITKTGELWMLERIRSGSSWVSDGGYPSAKEAKASAQAVHELLCEGQVKDS